MRIVLPALVLAGFLYAYGCWRIVRARDIVERRFAAVIADIEHESVAQTSYTTYDQVEQGLQRIEQRLSAEPAVAAAVWSRSFQHGMENLSSGRMSGWAEFSLWTASDSSGRRRYYFGRSFDGRGLIVLEGRVPDGAKPYYQIEFFCDALNAPSVESRE